MDLAGDKSKGKVTTLGSLFPADEAQKASKLVQDAILDCQSELNQLNFFVEDNSTLTKLVRKLPEEIFHQIMVPFGDAAFFPGQLIHTNEFMVLLGDGYYAEQTSKQTVDILKRREKSLKLQVEALKAKLLNLETEANFFDSTASDAKEGIVEIMEEYIEEPVQDYSSEMKEKYAEESQNESSLEEEHARIMARLSELEKEELEDDSSSCIGQDEDFESKSDAEASLGNDEDGASEPQKLPSSERSATKNTELSSEKTPQSSPISISDHNYSSSVEASGFNGRKAFTGTIVEHSHGLQPSNPPEKSTTSDRPSRPVSRFKMMQGNRR